MTEGGAAKIVNECHGRKVIFHHCCNFEQLWYKTVSKQGLTLLITMQKFGNINRYKNLHSALNVNLILIFSPRKDSHFLCVENMLLYSLKFI